MSGVVILLFVAYELWGTGVITAAHQRDLRQQFDQELRATHPGVHPTTPSTAPGGATTTSTFPSNHGLVPSDASATSGQPIAILQVPAAGIDFVVVQGTGKTDLEAGPGHYVNTSFPGNPGNAAIAGHRTTYLHPFYNLNLVVPGDPIYVTTAQGHFTYRVTQVLVVRPTDVSVLDDTPTPTLTLTTCNPRYSASTRLVVQAALTTPPAPVTAATRPTAAPSAAGPSGSSWGAALAWGAALVLAGVAVWLAFRWRRRWWVAAAGTVVLLALLYALFGAVGPLLPSGY